MKTRIWLGMLVIYIVWGSTYLAIRFAVATIPPFLMAGTRFLLAGILLLAWRRLAGDPWPRQVQVRGAGIMGLFLLLGGNGCVSWAEQRAPSGITALLIGATPFWIVLVDAVRPGGQRPSLKTLTGLLVGFAGIALLIQSTTQAQAAQRVDLIGVGVLLLGALLWAIGTVYGSQATLPPSPFMTTAVEMLVGGAGLLAVATAFGEWGRLNLATIDSTSFGGWLYLVVVGSLFALTVYTWLLRNAPLSLVSTYAYINPLVAIFLGNLLAAEPLTWQILVSAGVIISAVALVNSARFSPVPKTR